MLSVCWIENLKSVINYAKFRFKIKKFKLIFLSISLFREVSKDI